MDSVLREYREAIDLGYVSVVITDPLGNVIKQNMAKTEPGVVDQLILLAYSYETGCTIVYSWESEES